MTTHEERLYLLASAKAAIRGAEILLREACSHVIAAEHKPLWNHEGAPTVRAVMRLLERIHDEIRKEIERG